MYKFFLLIFSVVLMTIQFACSKKDGEITYHWKETWCSNPWQDNAGYTEDELKEVVSTYLESEKIKVKSIEIIFNESQAEFCEACNCLSGNNIVVTIDKKFEKKLSKLGFEIY